LTGVELSSLSAANFMFFTGAPADSITITGVPAEPMLTAGTTNGGGSGTLTTAQLAGLTLTAGEETTATLTVTATNTAGVTASSAQQTIALTVNPVAEPTRLSEAGRRAADAHVVHLHGLGRGALRVVDKLPDNVLLVGLIARLLPRARIVYCSRDPRDISLSCYFSCSATARNSSPTTLRTAAAGAGVSSAWQ